jgi:hypothetical protein
MTRLLLPAHLQAALFVCFLAAICHFLSVKMIQLDDKKKKS